MLNGIKEAKTKTHVCSYLYIYVYIYILSGDSLSRQNGQMFSTWDKDNDVSSMSCAQAYSGAWWYERCTYSNLNGVYKHVQDNNGYFIYWFQWKNNFNSLKTVEMKIRRA